MNVIIREEADNEVIKKLIDGAGAPNPSIFLETSHWLHERSKIILYCFLFQSAVNGFVPFLFVLLGLSFVPGRKPQ